jgi:PEP-CTERM motif
MKMFRTALLAAAAMVGLFLSGGVQAAQVFATSYDTPNGSGQASGGSFNYWDLNYTGAGATNVDGSALTGGLGDLTDGVIAPDFWFNVESGAGTGPWVGWLNSTTSNPLLTFNFAGSPSINQVTFHIDDSGSGGVFAPSGILIDGLGTSYVNGGVTNSLLTVSLTGLNLTGGSHTIQFLDSPNWIFVSEIQFFGAVPEPASWALMIAGFGLVGSAMRRRKPSVSVRFA